MFMLSHLLKVLTVIAISRYCLLPPTVWKNANAKWQVASDQKQFDMGFLS